VGPHTGPSMRNERSETAVRLRNETRVRWFNLIAPFLALLPLLGASPSPAIFRVFVYAPAQQDSPLHIAGLQYDEGGFIRLTLLNTSDKAISKAAIAAAEVAPAGCGVEPKTRLYVGGSVEALPIPPHGTVVTPPRGYAPSFHTPVFVTNAKQLRAASVHVQIVVMEVDFVDGTSWRSEERLPRTPFDPALAAADAGKCPDAEAVAKALTRVDEFEFNRRIDKPTAGGQKGTSSPPHLFFSCSIEGPKAICPTP
jgi:hypothetical protein